ncbi:RpiB/LacA/LacB family sugar-phosphate isomerase [Streptomyces sp. PSAA01]|uniref:RpiB/LacA/LacB family sugar-phosphate isomerase n=1 Tax=Streptomyces sp. PSAA01 TaxID=2912762 RepID=UPI001F40FB99|nr:RpiB/LacA/LacB family sugar-phosphate isomerase [Streptomyces sp. PSAA01]MCG0288230.1 hypothetical protein [Streptomyces sp. PSAA01]
MRIALGNDHAGLALKDHVRTVLEELGHDDTNAIAMGAWLIGPALAREALVPFLGARFDNDEATARRVAKLHQMERDAAAELTRSA